MRIKHKTIKFYYPYLIKKFNVEIANKVINDSDNILQGLLLENKKDPRKVKEHTFKKIYPAISIYKSLLKNDVLKDDAVNFIDYALCENAKKKAKSLQTLMKFPGAYKLMPKMFKKVTIKSFGLKADFRYKFYDTDKYEVRFDMTNCLYYNACKRYDCPEICKGFCHTDDVCNEHMHKNLKWARTQTIGEGSNICDFRLYVTDNDGNKLTK